MTLRARVILIVTGLVVVGIAVASFAAYRATADELSSQTDRFLTARADQVIEGLRPSPRRPSGDDRPRPRADELEFAFDPDAIAQSLDGDGDVTASEGGTLPVDPRDEAVARGAGAIIRDIEIDGEPYRMVTAPLPNGGAVQVAQETSATSEVLSRLAWRLAVVGAALALAAALLGWLLMRRTTRPLEELTSAAERVASTNDLTPLGLAGHDEVGRLAHSFDEMLGALRTSRDQQRQLVEDAGHELRTPLTSLRANVEFLVRAGELPNDQRDEILTGVRAEIAELAALVDELVLLATDDATVELPMTDLDLAEIVDEAVATFRRRTGRDVELRVEPTPVHGNAALLDRAVSNLLGNAHKFSPADEPIEVVLADRMVRVRDRGAGIDEAEAVRIFDRFHRAADARSEPGSGLGLAIVRYVADQHGGTVQAANAPDGGAVVGFSVAGRQSSMPAATRAGNRARPMS